MLCREQFFTTFTVFLLAVCPGWALAGTYSGGTGEPDDPYRIGTAEDLNDIGNHPNDWDKHFLVVADINLADYTGRQFNIIGEYTKWPDYLDEPFTGVFDGNGHIISGLTYVGAESESVGLCRYLGTEGQIRNVALEDVNIRAGTSGAGSLVGVNSGTVSGCCATGSIRGEGFLARSLGGLVGVNQENGKIYDSYAACTCICTCVGTRTIGGLIGCNVGTLIGCHASGPVDGFWEVGGLVGYNSGVISDCYASGTVTAGGKVGGLAGVNYKGEISDCWATGSISGGAPMLGGIGGLVGENVGQIVRSHARGPVAGTDAVGGLVGWNKDTICDSYAEGTVRGGGAIGGLVGYTSCEPYLGMESKVSNCYAAAVVDGNDCVGGLVGAHHRGSYAKCFWDSDVNPDANGIGDWVDPNVIGKSTPEMQQESTFTDASWDFVEIWDIGENQTYPFLRQYPAGDINHDRRVDFLDIAIIADHWLEGAGQ